MTQIRATHRYAFRRDQWADLIGTSFINNRLCYVVMFTDDHKIDYWVISDRVAGYEYRESNNG